MVKNVTFNRFRKLKDFNLSLSPITLLTGVNGAGKTSVLEGLYCLFSETRLDVSPLPRYNKSLGLAIQQGTNIAPSVATQQGYNYKPFWEECPTYGSDECSVEAKFKGLSWKWQYKKAGLADLDKQLLGGNLPVDSSTEFALWEWTVRGMVLGGKNNSKNIHEQFKCAQILTEGPLYLTNISGNAISVSKCRYFDFASFRSQPHKLSFQTSRQLKDALRIINSDVTEARLKDTKSGLSVVINDKYEVSLGTLGNGAVAWASALVTIFDVIETVTPNSHDYPVIVMIDEMGAGIHYSAMVEIWKFIKGFVSQNSKVQFLFTSHSKDCIQAFCEVFSGEDIAKIIHLYQPFDEEKTIPTEYPSMAFESIAIGDLEVR